MKMNKLTVAILISMLLGILTGQGYRLFAADQAADFANNITILTDIFLRLIKMIIAPLVFTTLVVGIAKMGDTRPWVVSVPKPSAGSCWPPCSP